MSLTQCQRQIEGGVHHGFLMAAVGGTWTQVLSGGVEGGGYGDSRGGRRGHVSAGGR